jgi:Rrf2 family protein
MSESSRFAVAVHALTLLAWEGGEPLKSEQIAASVNTNPVVIRRILCALSNAGLVTTQTGAAGGSRLARPPAAITLLDVRRAVECRPAFALHRRRPDRRCAVGANIRPALEAVLEETERATGRVLAGVTIADIVRKVRACARRRGGVGRRR